MDVLVKMSVSGAVLIAVIVIVRALAVNRLPKKAFLWLWAAAFFCLMIPVRLPSPISVYRPSGQMERLAVRPGLLLSEAAGQAASEASGAAAVMASHLSVWHGIWIAGAVLLAAFFLVGHLRGRRIYSASLPVEQPFAKAWLEENRIRRPVQIRYSDRIESPLTYGFLWPVLLVPADMDWADEETAAFILSHEMSHIRRFDAFTKWLLAAALCIHWFNPLVWAMYILANRDLELACDEAVIRQYGMQACPSYALALLGMEEKRNRLSPLASSFSKSALKERIEAIMKAKKLTKGSIAAALVVVAAVISIFATAGIGSNRPAVRIENMDKEPVAEAEENSHTLKNTLYQEYGWEDRYDRDYPMEKEGYTQEEYDKLMKALKPEGYEEMSIAAFNSFINKALTEDEKGRDGLYYLFEQVASYIENTDPNAGYLRNTIPASLEEYQTRLNEVYSGKQMDPQFSATAEAVRTADVFGDAYPAGGLWLEYSFTYRILDQDSLTVGERDAFLQQVMQAAQTLLEEEQEQGHTEQEFQALLDMAGKELANEKIGFTGCEVNYLEKE